MNGIPTILKDLRKNRNLTQFQLSQALKIGQATIAGYENGSREPHINSLIAYANFFECSVDYLLGREDYFGNITIQTEKPALLPHDKHAGENTLAFPGDVLSTISIYQKQRFVNPILTNFS